MSRLGRTLLRSVRARRLAAVTLVAAMLVPAAPAVAATADGDYQQVVDITFPLEEHVPVRYGDDYDASRGGGRHHQSTDLMVAMGTPVHAALGGTVRWMSGDQVAGPPSYGWMIRIEGDDGRTYAYVHLGRQDGAWSGAYAPGVVPGARVERGQLIGYAGCSGSATCGGGEHLHFEIHDEDVVDPYDHHDHERINPVWSLRAAERRGDYPSTSLFRDVVPGSTHHTDVETLAASGITTGCGSRNFCPTAPVTREQMASFLTRGLRLPAAPPHGFGDVPASNVHGADIAALARAGITKGCGPASFCPDQPVTREQMASFLVRALDLPPASAGAFSDVPASNTHARDIAALAAAGVTKGCGADRFCPDEPVTRQQMASFLVRALGL